MKVAAWLTIRVSKYATCARMSQPSEQIGSFGTPDTAGLLCDLFEKRRRA